MGRVYATLLASLLLTTTGCASRFYVGDPEAAPDRYHTPGRLDMPVEDQFLLVEPSSLQVLHGPPPNSWRPLGDIQTEKTNAAAALADLKRLAAHYGADGLLQTAAGAGSMRRSRSSESFSQRGLNFDSDQEYATVETTFGMAGTALRRAAPGSEAYLGIGCAGYSPSSVGKLGPHSEQLVPYVTSANGPAAAAGFGRGDFVMVWEIEGSEDVLSSNCAGLNDAIQLAGPGRSVHFTLWRADGESVERTVRVPHPRIVGADINPAKEGGLRVDEVLPHSPAEKAGIQVGDFLVSVNGQPVTELKQAELAIRSGPPTQELGMTRAGKALTIKVKTAPLTSIHTRDVPGAGVLVAWVYSASKSNEDELRPGDFLLDYATSADFEAALARNELDLQVRVRREGTPRDVKVTLAPIPDSWYREGAGLFARKAPATPPTPKPTLEAAPPPAPAPTAPSPAPTASPELVSPAPPLRACGSDMDCKGERVCNKGECVDPQPKQPKQPKQK